MKLLKYIKGLRKGKDAHHLEMEAMKDPFLADALEGFDSVGGDHLEAIKHLRKQTEARTNHTKRSHAIGWSIAASLLIGIGISSYFLFYEREISENQLAIQQDIHMMEELPSILPPAPSTANEEQDVQADVALEFTSDEVILVSEDTATDLPIKEAAQSVVMAEAKTTPKRKNVTGKVTDIDGEPIVGASIHIEHTQTGTVSDLDGHFSLETPPDAKLSIGYIGYEPIQMPVDTTQPMLIAMHESHDVLSEVVVVGHGSKKKVGVTTPKPIIGEKKFKKYLKENLRVPTDDLCKDKKGKVVLNFHVNNQGRPYDIIIKESLCESADAEALRLINEGPDWIVGEKEAKVTVYF